MDQDYMHRMLERHEHQMILEEERWFFGDDEDEEDLEHQLEQAEYYEER